MAIPPTIKMHGNTPEVSWDGKLYRPDETGTFELPREAAAELVHHGLKVGAAPAAKPAEPPPIIPEPSPVAVVTPEPVEAAKALAVDIGSLESAALQTPAPAAPASPAEPESKPEKKPAKRKHGR